MNSPLRIAVCSPQSALVTGGLERLCHELRVQFERRGHQVEAVRMPLAAHSKSAVVRSVLEWRLADLTKTSGGYDVVIATAFPSYYLQHPRKVTWLVAQFRFIYDLADTEFTRAEWLQDEQWRSALRDADAAALSESSRLLSISDNVGRRLQKFNGLHATTVYPPPFVVHEVSDQFGDFVLSVGRLEALKRHHILIDAMAGLDADARCVIVGTGAEKSALLEQIEARGATGRVVLAGEVSDHELRSLYREARAVFTGPYDEDLGLVALEAFAAGKPVITFDDSGGILEFALNGGNAWVTPPDAGHLALALKSVFSDPECCRRYGAAGQRRVAPLNWDDVIATLLAES